MKRFFFLLYVGCCLPCAAINYSDDPYYHDSRSLGFTNETPPLGHEYDDPASHQLLKKKGWIRQDQ